MCNSFAAKKPPGSDVSKGIVTCLSQTFIDQPENKKGFHRNGY